MVGLKDKYHNNTETGLLLLKTRLDYYRAPKIKCGNCKPLLEATKQRSQYQYTANTTMKRAFLVGTVLVLFALEFRITPYSWFMFNFIKVWLERKRIWKYSSVSEETQHKIYI